MLRESDGNETTHLSVDFQTNKLTIDTSNKVLAGASVSYVWELSLSDGTTETLDSFTIEYTDSCLNTVINS